MANRILKTTLLNGSNSFILHAYLESDGNEGELTNYVLIDKDELGKDVRPTVVQIWHSFSWFDAFLSFDDLVPVPSWNLLRDINYNDLRYFGGIKERFTDPKDKKSSDRTGQLLISTRDFAPLGSIGTLVLELKKSTV